MESLKFLGSQAEDCSTKDSIALVNELRRKLNETQIPVPIVAKSDSNFLSKFLRIKDWDVNSALEAIKKYYACVFRNWSFIEGIRPSDFTLAFRAEVVTPLKASFSGSRVAVIRLKNWKTQDLELRSIQLVSVFMMEQLALETEVQKSGIAVIFDLEGLRLEQVWKGRIKEIRRTVQAGLEGLPARVVGLHFIHSPAIFLPIFKLALKFIKEKIRKRIHFHQNLESLHNHFNKNLLPQSLGGNMNEDEAVDQELIKKLLEQDIPYEEYWNGAIGKPTLERRFNRKRSSVDLS